MSNVLRRCRYIVQCRKCKLKPEKAVQVWNIGVIHG